MAPLGFSVTVKRAASCLLSWLCDDGPAGKVVTRRITNGPATGGMTPHQYDALKRLVSNVGGKK